MRIAYKVLLVFAGLQLTLHAQDGTFSASVDRSKVGTAEQFQIDFTVSGSDVHGVSNFRQPDFGQFVVLSGPNQSQNFQFINGRTSASISYTYTLYARQTGNYTIGSASIDYKGKTLKTEPVQIEVVQGKPQQPQANAQQQPQQPLNLEDKVFIRVLADKQRAKQGEQITLTYRLYWSVGITSYDVVKAPTYEGFWAEDFELPKQPAVASEEYQGKRYQTATIKRTALFATQSGRLRVEPIQLRCPVQVPARRKSNDPFDMFFNDPFFNRMQTVDYELKSNALTLTVDPIPNSPAGFSGAVGKFTFSASVDKKEAKAGDAITLKLFVSGTGNVKLISMPKPNLPVDLEAYEPKISEEISRDGGVIRGKKNAEYIMIPRNAGARAIESIPFVYFDLGTNQYVTQRSPKFDLNILPGRDIAGSGIGAASKEDIKLLGEDIRFLKISSGDFRRHDESASTQWWFLAGFVFPPVLFFVALAYRKRMEKVYGDMPRLLFQRAGREASRRLKEASRLLAQGNTESYHSEIAKALRDYLGHKLQIPKAEMSVDEAIRRLEERGVSQTLVQQLRSCMERAEFARFAPGTDTRMARKDLLDAAKLAINGIEESMNGRR